MNSDKHNSTNDPIDLQELVGVLFHRLWIIILSIIVGGTAAGTATHVMVTPQYQATSSIYIFSSVVVSELQLSSQLTGDFQELAFSKKVLNGVIKELDLDTTYGGLKGCVNITNPSGTHIMQIQVTNPDPILAADICNALANELRDQISTIMNIEKPSAIDAAEVPTAPISPNVQRNIMKGGLLGGCLAAGIIILLWMMDATIKDDRDVEKYLKLNVIAVYPREAAMEKENTSKRLKLKTRSR